MGSGASTVGKEHLIPQKTDPDYNHVFRPLSARSACVQTSMVDFNQDEEELVAATANVSIADTLTRPRPRSAGVQTDPWLPEVEEGMIVPSKAEPDLHHRPRSLHDIWLEVDQTLDVPKNKNNPHKNLVVKRSGWKTIRIFVSSTVRDLHFEREVLVKKVFPELRMWCELRRLYLVECDLRWGVPADSTSENTLRTCLGEIDRCYQDNVMPFFLNLTSERVGWIPDLQEVPPYLVDEYRWIFGLSVTEMEIVHGAYRKDNPNSIFLLRNEDFLKNVPDKFKPKFVDENPLAPEKLRLLKGQIEERFPDNRVVHYTCEYQGEDKGQPKLRIDDTFGDAVLAFFKDRIDKQYPMEEEEEEEDIYHKTHEAHEAFLKNRCEAVLGRDDIINQMLEYVTGNDNDVPFILLGEAGTGKSSIMAKIADMLHTKAINKTLPGSDKAGWAVFYHFVGAVPGSTDLLLMLQRILVDIDPAVKENMPTDLEGAVQMTCSALNNDSTRPIIIIVDALNQMDEDLSEQYMNWVPAKLAPKVCCIFSMINDTPPHVNLKDRESKPKEHVVPPLSLAVRKDIVAEVLGKFNKKLDMDQMFGLLGKRASENPLWLSIATEELRVFGEFRKVSDQINNMADGLLELLQQVLTRFESEEENSHLLISTLCLIEVSSFGLLESELLSILADEENLLVPDKYQEKGEKEKSEKEKRSYDEKLPAFKWASVYRTLRTFLRPFGNSGEGRLDFYHRSLSKAVRKKYLKDAPAEGQQLSEHYKWWHSKLANFFEVSENVERRVEEYPLHLVKLGDKARLEKFLCDWRMFDKLYDREYSGKLIKYWHKVGELTYAMDCYSEMLQNMKNDASTKPEDLYSRLIKVGRFLVQCGIYDPAIALASEAEKIEKEQLGARPENLVELYMLMAMVWDQKVKLFEFISRAQIPDEKECLKYQEMSIDILKKLSQNNNHYKRLLGTQMVKNAFTLASFADCGGDETLSANDAREKGKKLCDDAIKIFEKQPGMIGNKAEALMTKAVTDRSNYQYQAKLYEEALQLALQAYGNFSVLTGRIYMNTAILYEDQGQYNKSYELFKKNWSISKEVYGSKHLRAQRAKNILSEPMYKRIARQQGDTELFAEDDEA